MLLLTCLECLILLAISSCLEFLSYLKVSQSLLETPPPQLYLSRVLMDYFPKLTFIVFFPFLLHGLTFLQKIYLKKNNISDHLSKVALLQNQTWVHLPSLSKANMLTSDSGERKHGLCCRAPSKENRHSCSKDVKGSVREGASEYVI